MGLSKTDLGFLADNARAAMLAPWRNDAGYSQVPSFSIGTDNNVYSSTRANGVNESGNNIGPGAVNPVGDTTGTWVMVVAASGTVGEIIETSNPLPEGDFFPLDGRPLSRTTYSTLFSEIGTSAGTGDGSTTFNIPQFFSDPLVGTWSNFITTGLPANRVGFQIRSVSTNGFILASIGTVLYLFDIQSQAWELVSTSGVPLPPDLTRQVAVNREATIAINSSTARVVYRRLRTQPSFVALTTLGLSNDPFVISMVDEDNGIVGVANDTPIYFISTRWNTQPRSQEGGNNLVDAFFIDGGQSVNDLVTYTDDSGRNWRFNASRNLWEVLRTSGNDDGVNSGSYNTVGYLLNFDHLYNFNTGQEKEVPGAVANGSFAITNDGRVFGVASNNPRVLTPTVRKYIRAR